MDRTEIQGLCESLRVIVKNREIDNFDRAAKIVLQLNEAFPDLIFFEYIGNMLIDILVTVSVFYLPDVLLLRVYLNIYIYMYI